MKTDGKTWILLGNYLKVMDDLQMEKTITIVNIIRELTGCSLGEAYNVALLLKAMRTDSL